MHRFLKLMSYVFAETKDKLRMMIGYIHEKGYLLSFCFRSATTGDACQSKNKTKQSGLLPPIEINGRTLIEAIV